MWVLTSKQCVGRETQQKLPNYCNSISFELLGAEFVREVHFDAIEDQFVIITWERPLDEAPAK